MTHQPRNDIPNDPNEWRHLLETGLEHASHVEGLLVQNGQLHHADPLHPGMPPNSSDAVGTVGYHFAAFLTYVCETYWSIAKFYPDANDNNSTRNGESSDVLRKAQR